MPDPLIQALVKKLPKPDSPWSLEDRAKWLRAAAIIFNLVYKPGEADSKSEEMPTELKSACWDKQSSAILNMRWGWLESISPWGSAGSPLVA
jgi:hypothetical protein